MPSKVFIELDKEKQQRVIGAAMNEFASFGYENASTNRIVKECGISKGSLFKYFENKEDLYFYIVDKVAADMASGLAVDADKLPSDLYERIMEYSVMEITWYVNNPLMGRFMISFASERDSSIAAKIMERYGKAGDDIYMKLMEGTDPVRTGIIKWVIKGYNSSFLAEMTDSTMDLEEIKGRYIKGLKEYLDRLKKGI